MAKSEDSRVPFSCWNEALKGQPEWLEMPVERKLYERAASVMESMGLKLEDAVLALLIKLSHGYSSLLGISPVDFATARLMRELNEGKWSEDEQGLVSEISIIEHIHRLVEDTNESPDE